MVDGVSNPYIKEWNVAEVQPTEEQLDNLESQAETLENNNLKRTIQKVNKDNKKWH
jgi:hypothetical protein